jgi:LPS-assembly lipoprotein
MRMRLGSVVRLGTVAVMALGLSACFRPLYGPTASGESLGALLASIEVDPAVSARGQERLGHYVRSELVFDLDGSGQPAPKRYHMTLAVSETVQTPLISSTTGRAESATLFGTAGYKVMAAGTDQVVMEGVASGTATYDRSVQRFASLRAARDAEIRLAKLLAEQIKIRVSAILATRP